MRAERVIDDSVVREPGPVDAVERLGSERFDAVILNSVVQYFPGVDYLLEVLDGAIERVRPGGFVYLGDVLPEERVIAGRKYLDYWGEKWILLPNPMYGDWEQALYDYDRSLGDAMKLNSKYSHLDTKP